MLRLLAAFGLLTIAGAISYDLDGEDESAYESLLREQGFSEEDIELFLQEYREAREEELNEDPEKVLWHVAKGYYECEIFKKRIYGKRDCTGCFKPTPLSEICAESECPPMEILNFGCGFEARKVLSANWAVTPIDTSDLRKGYTEAYWRLFKYSNKANNQGVRVAKTFYRINRWILDDKLQIESAQMAIYIPSPFQENPPTPTDGQVTVEAWDDALFYTRAFGGDITENRHRVNKQFKLLRKALKKEDITPYRQMKITYEYIRPGCGSQRNEVMLVDNEF